MKMSNRDWVQLSSYLDGELSPRERKRIEDRLSEDTGLQIALEELRQTKTVLQQTPKLKVPRDFVLTPAMIGVKTRPRPARGYRLASALMTFLLVGVLIVDLGRSTLSGGFAPAAPREVMLEAASDSAADALEEPKLMEAEEALDDDRAAQAEAEAPVNEESAPAVAAEAYEEGEAEALAEEALGKSTGEDAADTAANQADEWNEDEVVEEQALPSQTMAPDMTGTQLPQPTISIIAPTETIRRAERFPWVDPFRILEIILGIGALAFGAAAWVIRKRKS